MTEPVSLPVETLTEALPELRRPFASSAVKWKIQTAGPKGRPAEYAIVIGYIDARLVSARLNKVVGGNWSEKPIRIEGQGNALMYELTVFDQTHVDVGIGQGNDSDMKLKAVHSDALKRAAVRFGIGESLYAAPQITLKVTEDGAETNDGVPTLKRRRDGKPSNLREAHLSHLRKCYEDWLRSEAADGFGTPLSHGDAASGSVGDPVGSEEEADTATAPAALDDERAQELGTRARALRDEIRALDPDALPAQSFDTAMGQREHSHERLEDFVGNLAELKGNIERFEELRLELADKMDETELKAAVDKANRRGSRSERVEVLEEALEEVANR
jgi:hypothetical protein